MGELRIIDDYVKRSNEFLNGGIPRFESPSEIERFKKLFRSRVARLSEHYMRWNPPIKTSKGFYLAAKKADISDHFYLRFIQRVMLLDFTRILEPRTPEQLNKYSSDLDSYYYGYLRDLIGAIDIKLFEECVRIFVNKLLKAGELKNMNEEGKEKQLGRDGHVNIICLPFIIGISDMYGNPRLNTVLVSQYKT